VHAPQSIELPQPSPIGPHDAFALAQVTSPQGPASMAASAVAPGVETGESSCDLQPTIPITRLTTRQERRTL